MRSNWARSPLFGLTVEADGAITQSGAATISGIQVFTNTDGDNAAISLNNAEQFIWWIDRIGHRLEVRLFLAIPLQLNFPPYRSKFNGDSGRSGN